MVLDIASAALGLGIGTWATTVLTHLYRKRHPLMERFDKLSHEVRELEEKLRLTQASEHYAKSSASDLAKDLKRAIEQRDDYKKIAQTHDITQKKENSDEGTSWLAFENKEYMVHPKVFLEMLEEDIKKIDCDTIALTIKYYPLSVWWDTILRDIGNGHLRKNNNKDKEAFGFSRSGEPMRVLDSVKTFMMTVDNQFVFNVGGQSMWRYDHGYLQFNATCRAFKASPPKPDIRFVEVLRVEECLACKEHADASVPTEDKIDESKTPQEIRRAMLLNNSNSFGPL